ncbi:E3 ubiquitin-protein ligase TRIM62-like [Alosa pseudoharengus]|uniref:E3 ubiquitin-protein ligase TRIM62-like n=1 Tax=Alosa pseudoharengus TaxID=34774 RepID=UPI003F8999F9
MAASLTIQLQCPACRNIFTDPVDLPCSHTFCQKCLLDLLQPSSGQQPCPECSQPFSLKDLKPNSLLKNWWMWEEIKRVCEFVSRGNSDIEFLLKQRAEGDKTKEKSRRLSAEISGHFEQMRQFLRKKEAELKRTLACEEERAVENIQRSTATIEGLLQDGRSMQENLQGALLKLMSSYRYKSKVKGLSLTLDSLDLGPYESHLPFFVWKEMLQTIKPVPERLILRDPRDRRLSVSLGGSSVRQTDQQDAVNKDYNPMVVALETFQTGCHYWEVEVGEKLDWGVGVCVSDPQFAYVSESIMLMLRHNKGYCVREFKSLFPIEVWARPRRVGIYLDCERKLVSFYNANSMALLYASTRPFARVLSLCLSPGLYLDGHNSAPLTSTLSSAGTKSLNLSKFIRSKDSRKQHKFWFLLMSTRTYVYTSKCMEPQSFLSLKLIDI